MSIFHALRWFVDLLIWIPPDIGGGGGGAAVLIDAVMYSQILDLLMYNFYGSAQYVRRPIP